MQTGLQFCGLYSAANSSDVDIDLNTGVFRFDAGDDVRVSARIGGGAWQTVLDVRSDVSSAKIPKFVATRPGTARRQAVSLGSASAGDSSRPGMSERSRKAAIARTGGP